MIQISKRLVCGEDHGQEQFFPSDGLFDPEHDDVHRLRREAKKAGWSRVNGEDYCDMCSEALHQEHLQMRREKHANRKESAR